MVLSWRSVHLVALREASRVHHELGTDLTRQIDPFEALAALEVVVIRRPLSGAAGLYLPVDLPDRTTPGVLVNVLHPVSKQRYTAAHELAHHRRDRTAIIDVETEWLARDGTPQNDRERIAEAFAAWFLMPQRLVVAMLARLDIDASTIDPRSAYRLALALGTSYQATVHHLGDLQLIRSAHRRALLALTPGTIKESLGARATGRDLRRDVWQLDPDDPQPVSVVAGDVLVVDLDETPSSGYRWDAQVPDGMTVLGDEWHAPANDGIGGQGIRRFWFSADAPGHAVVALEQSRPWRADVVERHEFAVDTSARPAPGLVDPGQLVLAGA